MAQDQVPDRNELSGKLTNVLNARTLAASHPGLANLLTPGMRVLDLGCGTGAITRGIAEAVGPTGSVVGMDHNPHLIEQARQAHSGIPGLTFETGDIYQFTADHPYDVVTSARLLIWLKEPLTAIQAMRSAAKKGGRIVIADYNHEKIAWDPEPPASMLHFYTAYLAWREDAGLDNTIGDRLQALLQQAGLKEITIHASHEYTQRGDAHFAARMGIWADTASSRGPQMQRDGFLTEAACMKAEQQYRAWIAEAAQAMKMYMMTVEGVV